MLTFKMHSPTITEWKKRFRLFREGFLDSTDALEIVLENVREDINEQFDENQNKWKPLVPFTLSKKKQRKADLRTLHETQKGQGLRLREAWARTGAVRNGKLVIFYPPEKKYAKEHQLGAVVDIDGDTHVKKKPSRQARAIERSILKKELDLLDSEFLRRINED